MKWKTEFRKLGELVIYDKNPRILTETAKNEIRKSLTKFSLVELPAINTDNTIIAGHQRIKILTELNGPDFEIEVRVPESKLSEKDFKEYLLRSNRNKAEWDWNMLENDFSVDLLLDSGFEAFEVDVDKVNLDNCFTNMDSKKKKVKVTECEICKKPITLDIKYFIKNNTFDNFNFKDSSENGKIIYDRIKDLLVDFDVHLIVVEKEKEE